MSRTQRGEWICKRVRRRELPKSRTHLRRDGAPAFMIDDDWNLTIPLFRVRVRRLEVRELQREHR